MLVSECMEKIPYDINGSEYMILVDFCKQKGDNMFETFITFGSLVAFIFIFVSLLFNKN